MLLPIFVISLFQKTICVYPPLQTKTAAELHHALLLRVPQLSCPTPFPPGSASISGAALEYATPCFEKNVWTAGWLSSGGAYLQLTTKCAACTIVSPLGTLPDLFPELTLSPSLPPPSPLYRCSVPKPCAEGGDFYLAGTIEGASSATLCSTARFASRSHPHIPPHTTQRYPIFAH